MTQDVDFYAPSGGHVIPARRRATAPASAAPPPLEASNFVDDAPPREPLFQSDDPRLSKILELMRLYFHITPEAYADPQCQRAVMLATSMCLTYGFFPGRHVRVRQIAGVWTCEDSYRAWLDAANKMAGQQNFTFYVDTVEMDESEVRGLLGPDYSPGDKGFFARVVRSDHLALHERMKQEYAPAFRFGFWRRKGYPEFTFDGRPTGHWLPDPIYRGRDAAYTAELRARKAALMESFSLVELDAGSQTQRIGRLLLDLSGEIEEREMKKRDKGDPRFTSIMPNPEATASPDFGVFAQ